MSNGNSGGWNRPASNQPVEKKGTKSPSKVTGIVAGVIVVALGALCLWMFSGDGGPKEKTTKDRGLIKEVKPALPAKPVETNVVKKVDPNARPTKVGEVVNGYIKLPSGKIHRQLGVITNSVADRPKLPYHIFNRSCDNEIAAYLWMKPGDMIVGPMNHKGRFTKDFLESLSEPIIVSKDDTPEQAQLKREVIEAKKELKARYDAGEDIDKIMDDTRTELQDLMRYKDQVRALYNEAKLKDCKTDKDVEDLVDACNKMLEEKGIAPLKLGPFGRRKFRKVITE